ncbi:MAG: YicC family protein [Clostridia bacterium]|nr:YicC family protein [Clostridia bacterium]
MIKSMTGFGRHREAVDGYDIICEVKSVNSRYLDTNIKISRAFGALEDNVRRFAANKVSRGKLDIYVSIDRIGGEKNVLTANDEFIGEYVRLMRGIKKRCKLSGNLSVDTLALRNEVFSQSRPDEDMDAAWKAVETVLEKAFAVFSDMRAAEGRKLCDDLLGHIAALEGLRADIAKRAPAAVAESNEKMKARIKELLGGVDYDEGRLLTECAIFADKADISEELARLDSHFTQFRAFVEEDVPVGRKLDFLVQEMNREVNTIGSKANDGSIAKTVIDAKSAVEKVREQIQNVE